MGRTRSSLSLAILLFVVLFHYGFSGPDTVPAFLWSPHYLGPSQNIINEFVNYHTMSPKELTNSVLSEGGWSEILCPTKNLQQNVDTALVFVGRKLTSSDISRQSNVDPALVDVLKKSFTTSNFSMAYPYVEKSNEETLVDSIISGFIEKCGVTLNVHRIASTDACSFGNEGFTKISDVHSIYNYLSLKAETRMKGQTDLIVFCDKDLHGSENVVSEGETFSVLLNSLEQIGSKYTVLYTSDPFTPLGYGRSLDRFLAEGSNETSMLNSTTCDGLCEIKSSLLEGLFVAIILIIILLSGLCCMSGIDTPTKFETPQE
ncbi:hypothetical protein ZOSMA_31G00890 [Zostera marina]|uniref:V-type proton ATPase subunit S1/VOA1 transmembrane domain-containing protein n=1 Tax=Zostera marina TaxID=29655 RepID=A0A0K9P924_ZOSMR|nr:hypothetical protein ZOSMA_31G00890 [Zostera marina]